jgi:rod shape-determining protein MreB
VTGLGDTVLVELLSPSPKLNMLRHFIQKTHNQVPGAPANHHLRAVRDHVGGEARGARVGRSGRRARGLFDRGTDGGGHRRGAADHRALGQHDRRHGGGTTEVAVVLLAGVVFSRSVRVAGDKKDEAIIQHIKRKYNLLIGERTAELIKITIGSAYPGNEIQTMEIKGRDLVAGVLKIIEITDEEIREALMEPVHQVVESVRIALERTPPELASQIRGRCRCRDLGRLSAQPTQRSRRISRPTAWRSRSYSFDGAPGGRRQHTTLRAFFRA